MVFFDKFNERKQQQNGMTGAIRADKGNVIEAIKCYDNALKIDEHHDIL